MWSALLHSYEYTCLYIAYRFTRAHLHTHAYTQRTHTHTHTHTHNVDTRNIAMSFIEKILNVIIKISTIPLKQLDSYWDYYHLMIKMWVFQGENK